MICVHSYMRLSVPLPTHGQDSVPGGDRRRKASNWHGWDLRAELRGVNIHNTPSKGVLQPSGIVFPFSRACKRDVKLHRGPIRFAMISIRRIQPHASRLWQAQSFHEASGWAAACRAFLWLLLCIGFSALVSTGLGTLVTEGWRGASSYHLVSRYRSGNAPVTLVAPA